MKTVSDKTCRILVVDDFSTIRRIIKNQLTQMGYRDIKEAEDGVQALRVLRENTIDFVVTDWNMPNMTGFELLQQIRMREEFQAIPVLMVTAETKREQILAAAEAGVNGYIVKPFAASALSEKINLIARRQEAQAAPA